MGQELQLPDWAKGKKVSQAFQGLNAQSDSLADGIGQSYGVIGYKGKVWSLRVRGERHNIIRPDDGTPSNFIDVIILGQARVKSKSYYKKFDQSTSDGDRPICSSIDGVVPDLDVVHKESDTCALCPRNVWKRDAVTGRNGRECTDYKRLAVLVLPTQTAPILNGKPLMEPVFLRVPPDSLNSLAIMGEGMSNQGYHYSSYITRITFDPEKAHPCMVFRPLQGLTDGEAPVILDLRKDAAVDRITGGDKTSPAVSEPTQDTATGLTVIEGGLTTKPVASPGVVGSLPQTAVPATNSVTQDTSSNGLASALVATKTGAAAPEKAATSTLGTTTTSTGLVDTGFGGATPATPTGAAPTGSPEAVVVSAQGDTGEAEESDEALDAHIASLIRK